MIKIEHLETAGWEAAIRGMRNPKNSWEKSDSGYLHENEAFSGAPYMVGPNDSDLMSRLNRGGPVHAKYRRMITVWCDITAPLYWWKEFDTYKVGTVANSCSTIHKLGEKEFELEDFSCEKLVSMPTLDEIDTDSVIFGEFIYPDTHPVVKTNEGWCSPIGYMNLTVRMLNKLRELWLKSGKKDKTLWYQMIQLLPSSYNQRRTVELNYEVLTGMYRDRKNHKLNEWGVFCKVMKEHLPESWIFTGEE